MVAIADSSVRSSLSLITHVHVKQWGREVEIEGLDDPVTRKSMRLIFHDCREIRWSNYDEAASEFEADVIGLCPGSNDYAEPAVITTDLFELSILYRTSKIDSAPISFEVMDGPGSVAKQ